MKFIRKFAELVRRNLRARRMGVTFGRSATFSMPTHIRLAGINHELSLPDENGVKVAFIELLLDDCYRCHDLSKRRISIKTVIDVGANVGLFSIAARNAFPEAIIHCYEPNAELEKYLRRQCETAGAKYHLEAVCEKNGFVELELNVDSVQTRSNPGKADGIRGVALSEVIDRIGGNVDFLKIDCEGAEWELFRDKNCWRAVKFLAMEYHLWPDHDHDEVKEVVSGLGFTITGFYPEISTGLLTAERRNHE